jgi:predicted DCC family thiol-disulfide oxidoreductase YuxK
MRYASLQGATAQQMIRELGPSVPDSIILWQEGHHLVRSAAVAAILKSLGGPWHAIGYVLGVIPNAVADRGYDFIARNRYRWFGKKDSCRLPSPAERNLFLE